MGESVSESADESVSESVSESVGVGASARVSAFSETQGRSIGREKIQGRHKSQEQF